VARELLLRSQQQGKETTMWHRTVLTLVVLFAAVNWADAQLYSPPLGANPLRSQMLMSRPLMPGTYMSYTSTWPPLVYGAAAYPAWPAYQQNWFGTMPAYQQTWYQGGYTRPQVYVTTGYYGQPVYITAGGY
jgi:hypothetical protein